MTLSDSLSFLFSIKSTLRSVFTCPALLFLRWGAVDSVWQLMVLKLTFWTLKFCQTFCLAGPQRVLKLDSSNGCLPYRRLMKRWRKALRQIQCFEGLFSSCSSKRLTLKKELMKNNNFWLGYYKYNYFHRTRLQRLAGRMWSPGLSLPVQVKAVLPVGSGPSRRWWI